MTGSGTASTPLRIAHVDDHETVQLGFAALLSGEDDLLLVTSAYTVADILDQVDSLDLVVLDLRLSDGSTVEHNLTTLAEHGVRVLALTGADDPAALRTASRSGALGVVRKSENRTVVLDAVRKAARGETVVTTEWAAAVDSDPLLSSAGLSPKEEEVLALYASGDKSLTVASQAGLSTNTVAEYVRRIRHKYAMAGRPAQTKVDLYKRAVEDGILPSPRS